MSNQQYRIQLTGERRRGLHLIYLFDKSTWITASQLVAIAELVRARLESETGYLTTSDSFTPVIVCRLRRVLGSESITTGAYKEYRLALPRKAISICQTFSELPAGLLRNETFEFLKQYINSPAQEIT